MAVFFGCFFSARNRKDLKSLRSFLFHWLNSLKCWWNVITLSPNWLARCVWEECPNKMHLIAGQQYLIRSKIETVWNISACFALKNACPPSWLGLNYRCSFHNYCETSGGKLQALEGNKIYFVNLGLGCQERREKTQPMIRDVVPLITGLWKCEFQKRLVWARNLFSENYEKNFYAFYYWMKLSITQCWNLLQ